MEKLFREIFNDGKTNWGRIIVAFALATHLVKHNKKVSHCQVKNTLMQILTEQQHWIDEKGGWDNFCDFVKMYNRNKSISFRMERLLIHFGMLLVGYI